MARLAKNASFRVFGVFRMFRVFSSFRFTELVFVEDNIEYNVHVCVCGCTASINRTVPLYSCTIIRIISVHNHFYVPTYSLRTILLNTAILARVADGREVFKLTR